MDILEAFESSRAFEEKRSTYSIETLDAFRTLIVTMHNAGLDWYITNMESGQAIRCGRKEIENTNGKTFLLIEPKDSHIVIEAHHHNDRTKSLLEGTIDQEFNQKLFASSLAENFSQHNTTKTIRIGFMPGDY